ncbi:MAG TPA: MATE family efflux transporter [Thermotoga sp.]|nr:MATE family efflux transporter [Thermotoga sp.]
MLRNTKVDVFANSIYISLFKLSWPIMITNIIQSLYNMVDAFYLGKLGKVKFSAPTIVFPIVFTFMSFSMGLASAGTALIAQHVGSRNIRKAENIAMQILMLSVFISMIISLWGFFNSGWILKLLNIEEPIFSFAKSYLEIIFLGMPFSFIMFVIVAIVRGWGNTVFTMNISIISIFLNIILDPFLIFGVGFPRLEVVGAALATVVSRAVASIYSLYILSTNKLGFKLHLKDIKPNWKTMLKILRIGMPAAIGQMITAMGFSVIMGIIAAFGPAVVSAFGVGNRITSAIIMIGMSISGAVSTMVGQFLGADDLNRVDETVKKGAIITFSTVSIMCVFLFFFGKQLTWIFVDDPEVIKLGEIYFKLVSFSVPLFSILSIIMGAFQGSGHNTLIAIVNITRLWGIRIPLVKIFADLYGFKGVFYAMTISNMLALLLGYSIMKLVKWKNKVI